MPPRKRKNDAKQHSLEEVTEKPVKTKKSKKGDLANPEIITDDTTSDDLAKRRLARKHQGDPAFEETKTAAKKSDASKSQAGKADKSETKAEDKDESGAKQEPAKRSDEPVVINRAPVLTLWVSAVAQREGYSRDSGVTFGKAISGILAQSKGRSIGIYEKKDGESTEAKAEHDEKDAKDGIERIEVFGMTIKAVKKDGQYFATESGSADPMDPQKCSAYLQRAFKDRLHDAEAALKELAESFKKDDIGSEAYHLYEQFRPQVASGQQGWGKKGELDLKSLKDMHKSD